MTTRSRAFAVMRSLRLSLKLTVAGADGTHSFTSKLSFTRKKARLARSAVVVELHRSR